MKLSKLPLNMPPIIYEDKNILVLNKPAGLTVHGDGKSDEKTLVDFLLEKYPELEHVGEPMKIEGKAGKIKLIPRPGIVHRLDKDTSGVIIVAKNQETFTFLKQQFKDRKTEKVYYAYTYGWLKNDKGPINMPIGRSAGDIRMWTTGKGARGTIREAWTDFEVMKRIPEDKWEESRKNGSTEEGTYTYVKLMPKTGRTHQLRVHMKYINHPIIGDPIYAPNRPLALGFNRLALHAQTLTISLPDGKTHTFEAPFPEDFQNALTVA